MKRQRHDGLCHIRLWLRVLHVLASVSVVSMISMVRTVQACTTCRIGHGQKVVNVGAWHNVRIATPRVCGVAAETCPAADTPYDNMQQCSSDATHSSDTSARRIRKWHACDAALQHLHNFRQFVLMNWLAILVAHNVAFQTLWTVSCHKPTAIFSAQTARRHNLQYKAWESRGSKVMLTIAPLTSTVRS